MLIKWILCEVDEHNKDAFSEGQEEWAALQDVDGFMGQFGGWSCQNPPIC